MHLSIRKTGLGLFIIHSTNIPWSLVKGEKIPITPKSESWVLMVRICFLLQKIGCFTRSGEDETSVWIHSTEGTGKCEQCGEGSMKEGAGFAVGAL